MEINSHIIIKEVEMMHNTIFLKIKNFILGTDCPNEGKGARALFLMNRFSILLHILLSCGICFAIEWISRHSFTEACSFLMDRTTVFLYNSLLVFTSLTVVYLFRRRCLARILISVTWLLLGTVNGCVLLKRVTPFSYTDLKMVKDLLTMQSNYFTKQEEIFVVIGLIVLVLLLILLAIKGPKYKGHPRRITCILAMGAMVFLIPTVTNAAVSSNVLASYFENLAQGYSDYGFIYSFAASVVDRGMSKPDNYNEETIHAIMDSLEEEVPAATTVGTTGATTETGAEETVGAESTATTADTTTESTVTTEGTTGTDEAAGAEAATVSTSTPNVICVLLESFIDPYEIKFLNYSEDPTPNFHALYDSYTSGHLQVPVVGAGTANTEFEVLTGMGMKFFGLGEYPYKTILKSDSCTSCESVASILETIGYGSHVVHNNGGNFYSRANAFQKMGFDTFTSKEMINIQEWTPLGTWPTDNCLIEETGKALDLTPNQPDFTYTITVQGHGTYPTERVIENPEILVSGAATEEENYQWEYYINMIHEVDKFIGNLLTMLSERNEPTVVVFFGDHLPTMGLTAEDMTTGSIFQTKYITWNNFGLAKNDKDITSYQLMSYILEQIGVHKGTMVRFHQTNQYEVTDTYTDNMELLQYDILYGERYAYGGEDLYPASDLVMGVADIVISSLEETDRYLMINGENYTPWSRVFVNGEKVKTTFISSSQLQISLNLLSEGDNTILVNQMGSSNTVFRSSNETTFLYTPKDDTSQETDGTSSEGTTGESGTSGDGTATAGEAGTAE